MFRLFQDKSLTVKLFWSWPTHFNDFQSSLGVPNIFIQFSGHKSFLFIIDQVLYFVECYFVIFMISALSRLFKFGKYCLSCVSISLCISASNQSCELFFTWSFFHGWDLIDHRCDLSNEIWMRIIYIFKLWVIKKVNFIKFLQVWTLTVVFKLPSSDAFVRIEFRLINLSCTVD